VPFTQIPNQVFTELMPRLSGAAFKVFMAIAHKARFFSDQNESATIGYAELCHQTGLHKDTVRRAVRECIDKDCLRIVEDYCCQPALCRVYELKFRDHN